MGYALIIYICWGIAGLVWAIGALYNALNAPRAARRGAPSLLLMLVVLAIVYVNNQWGPAGLWRALRVRSDALAITGSVALVAGTLFTLWARFVLGTMWSSSPVAREDHALKTSGPYAVTRNPIYTGGLIMLVGTALINGLGVWVLYLIMGVIYAEIKIRFEERLMIETFGDGYTRYRQQVPQLIPGLNLLHRGQHAGG